MASSMTHRLRGRTCRHDQQRQPGYGIDFREPLNDRIRRPPNRVPTAEMIRRKWSCHCGNQAKRERDGGPPQQGRSNSLGSVPARPWILPYTTGRFRVGVTEKMPSDASS
jgi:hypothetical protein